MKTKKAGPVAHFCFEEIFCFCGYVRYLITDNGREFRNKKVGELLAKLLGIQQRFTKPYSPQTNGLAERVNGVLAAVLAKILREDKTKWVEHIYHALYAQRHTINVSTGFAPSALMLGQDVVTVLYVSIRGAPAIDEDAPAGQLAEEEDNAKDFVGAEVDEANLRREFDAAKAGDEMIGTARYPQSLLAKRPAPHRKNSDKNAQRRKIMYDVASANQKDQM